MKKLVVVMSHSLTNSQIQDAKDNLGVNVVSQLTGAVASQCKTIPANWNRRKIDELAIEIITAAKKEGATHISVMGEPCLVAAVYILCSGKYGFSDTDGSWINATWSKLNFVQATTERVSKDETQADGSVRTSSIFNHVQWRAW